MFNNRIYPLLIIGLFAISTSPVIAKLLPYVPATVIAFWRMAIASGALWLYTSFFSYSPISPKNSRLVYLAGASLAMHFIFWFGALKLTSIANTTVLGIVAPAFTLLIEKLVYGKEINTLSAISLMIIFIGCIIVQGSDLGNFTGVGLGNIMAIVSAVFLGIVFLIGSRVRQNTGVLPYTKNLFTVSAIVLLLCSLLLDNSIVNYSIENYFWLFMLGMVPTLIGHTIFSYSIKFVSPTIIASIPLGEPIIASILAFILFNERIYSNVVIGGVVIGIGLILLIRNNKN
ncbi:MAG: DMT family transporter [Candidatus Neomarinimicrobiota bacterium]|nr:DMT family transporter [Candidatus Neomarinimicrobiota bacterium]